MIAPRHARPGSAGVRGPAPRTDVGDISRDLGETQATGAAVSAPPSNGRKSGRCSWPSDPRQGGRRRSGRRRSPALSGRIDCPAKSPASAAPLRFSASPPTSSPAQQTRPVGGLWRVLSRRDVDVGTAFERSRPCRPPDHLPAASTRFPGRLQALQGPFPCR